MNTYLLVFILFFIHVPKNNCSTLQQLHIFIRHGERTPTETYKNDPYVNYSWPGGWGQLTNNGKLEMFELGRIFRDEYNDFIPNYYYNTEVEVSSSYSDRCLMTAQVFLAGLFPPQGDQIWTDELLWQPIPVKYESRAEDKVIAQKSYCKKYDETFKDVRNSEEFVKLDEENSELYKVLTKYTGQDMDTIEKVEFLYNTLEIEMLFNLTLPDWVKEVSLDHMKYLGARNLAAYTHVEYMKRIKGGPFLRKAIDNMKNNTLPKVYIYAGHDISIVSILRSLGSIDLLKPGFGASFVVELYSNSVVKIFYRHDVYKKPEQLQIPNCEEPCLLDTLENVLQPVLPIDWQKECDNI